MTKQQLENKVLELEERMLAMISGNIKLISDIERIKTDFGQLLINSENVVSILKQRDDELKENFNSSLKNDEINKNRLLNLEMEVDNIKIIFNDFIVKHEAQCKRRINSMVKNDLVKTTKNKVFNNESDLPF